MDKNNKHIIPKDQYKRRRRVFTDDQQGPMRNTDEHANRSHDIEYGNTETGDSHDDYGYHSDPSEEDAGHHEANLGNEDNISSNSLTSEDERNNDNEDSELNVNQNQNLEGDRSNTEREDDSYGYTDSGEKQYVPSDSEETSTDSRETDNTENNDSDKNAAIVGAAAVNQRSNRHSSAGGRGGDGGNGSGGNNNRGGSGGNDNNGGKKRGPFTAFILPLIAGMIGALIILLGFIYFSDDNGTASNTASDQSSDSAETAENVENTQEDLNEETDENRDVSDTTAAIQVARESVVSVINMQQAQSIIPGYEGEGGQSESEDPEEAGVGSGVIYKLTDDSAYIVTNNHVVDGAEELQVNLESGDSITGELVGSDVWTDLAVIRVDKGDIDQTIPFGNSDDLLVGEEAIAIGSPLGEDFSGSVSQGIISGLDRSVPVDLDGDGSYDWESNVIQTDAAINPGNSGGALINSAGELIGINSMKISMPTVEGIGFAIPANEVEKITSQIEENGEVDRPFLGVTLQDLYTVSRDVIVNEMNVPEDVEEGVVVSGIQGGSPAESAGLQELDLIVAMDGNEVGSMMELRQYLYYEKQPGDDMEIEFYRQGERQTATITLE